MRMGFRNRGSRRNSAVVVTGTLLLALGLLPCGMPPAQAQPAEPHGTLRPVTVDGLGNPGNYGFQRLYQFEGYLWTVAGNLGGALIYRTADGENWEPVNPPGFDGSPQNDSMATLAWFRGANDPPGSQGQLYAATYRFRGSGPFAGDIWRSSNALADDPAEITWEKVFDRASAGREDIQSFVGFAPFKDHLYVATFVNNFPAASGAEIFRTGSGNPGDWHVVTPDGMDDPQCNTDFHWNIVFGERLYFGSEEAGCVGRKGGEIWRTDGNLTDGQETLDGWEKVLAEPGFGHPWNNNIFGMDVFQRHFYGATWNWNGGMEVFRAPVNLPHEGENPVPFVFEQVSLPGIDGDPRNSVNVSMVHLGDTLYVAGVDLYGADGGYVFRTSGASTAAEHLSTWNEITAEEFPPPTGGGALPLDGPFWLEVFKNKVYVAVEQGGHGVDGHGQIWVYEPTVVPDFGVTDVTACAPAGGLVTIAGTGFDDYQGDSSVRLAGEPIPEVTQWLDTEIIVELPPDARSGELVVLKDGMLSDPRPLTTTRPDAPAGQCLPGPTIITSTTPAPDDVSVGWSTQQDPPTCACALLARDDVFADALASGFAQGADGGPLLLTNSAGLTPAVRTELERLGTQQVTILGGTAAVSQAVEVELIAMGLEIERVFGATRIETAIAITRAFGPGGDPLVVRAFGSPTDPTAGFADSLAAGREAARSGRPVLLTHTGELPSALEAYLDEAGATAVTVIGGPAAVSESVVTALQGMNITATRVAGSNRAGTAVAVATQLARAADAADAGGVVLVDGVADAAWADGFAAAGYDDPGPLLLTAGGEIPAETLSWLGQVEPGTSVPLTCGALVSAAACSAVAARLGLAT